MPATPPIELLRELRRVFAYEAAEYRKLEQGSFSSLEQRATAAKAYAAENVVKKIDATLRDWA